MTIAEAKRRLGVKTDNQLAIKLGVSRFAVGHWRGRLKHRLPPGRVAQVSAMKERK